MKVLSSSSSRLEETGPASTSLRGSLLLQLGGDDGVVDRDNVDCTGSVESVVAVNVVEGCGLWPRRVFRILGLVLGAVDGLVKDEGTDVSALKLRISG